MNIHTIILAAGEGTRMISSKAKSLQPIGGQSMLKRIYETVSDITTEISFVVGYGKESIIKGKGRHDPCVVPRAISIVEAMAWSNFLRICYGSNSSNNYEKSM